MIVAFLLCICKYMNAIFFFIKILKREDVDLQEDLQKNKEPRTDDSCTEKPKQKTEYALESDHQRVMLEQSQRRRLEI